MNATNENTYVRVKNEDGVDYLCPLDKMVNINIASVERTVECVEKDVVERYSSNIDLLSV